jgi:coenzyme F420-dependent glucose-6-phosphate dehydrogenase
LVKFGILINNISFDPRDCVNRAPALEKAGFDDIWDGDHILPWYHTDGHASSLPVQLERYLTVTEKIKVGSMVWCPIGIRWQPVDVALAAATMALLHDDRFILGIGTGEAMNEKAATGFWPSRSERVERFEEAVQLIKKCWTERDYFHHKGKYFDTTFYLYDRPKKPIPLIIAANGPKTARIAGKYGDGIISIASPDEIKNKFMPIFEKSAKEAGKDPDKLEKMAFVSTSYHPEEDKAYTLPRRSCGYLFPELFEVLDPRQIEKKALTATDDVIKSVFNVGTTADQIIEGFDRYFKVGITHIVWDELSYDPWMTPTLFKEKIKPYFDEQYPD